MSWMNALRVLVVIALATTAMPAIAASQATFTLAIAASRATSAPAIAASQATAAPNPRVAPSAPAAAAAARDSAARATRLSDADEARARGLEGRLKCPVCRTQSVLESTSFMALEMRAKIRELISAGRSDGQILDYFAQRYGDYILLEPRKKGFALAAYLLPLLAVLVGGTAILRALSRRDSGKGASSGADVAENGGGGSAGQDPAAGTEAHCLSPADQARIDQELERYSA